VYKAALESKSKTRQKVEAEINNLLVKKDVIMNEIHNLEHEKEEVVESIVNEGIIPIQAPIPPAGVGINSVVGTVDAESIAMKIIQSSQISQEEKNRQRLGELARERKQKTANMTMNTG
jgi:hypothetical protein